MEHVKTWLTGELGCARAGDGMSYSEHMNIIQKHFPDAKMEFNSIGNTDAEVSKVVSGITNMILELSKWDGVMSGVAMKTWKGDLGRSGADRCRAYDKGVRGEAGTCFPIEECKY